MDCRCRHPSSSFRAPFTFVEQLGVALLDSDRVILVSVSGVEDLEAAVCSNIVLSRLLVDNNAVDLIIYQCSNCERAVVELLYMLLTVVAGAVDVAGGAGLNADVLALQIIREAISEPSLTMMT